MKLLMATHYFDSHRGGIEIVAARLARELSRRGVAVTWLATDATPPPAVGSGCGTCHPVPAWNITERRAGFPLPLPGPRAAVTIWRDVKVADVVLLHDSIYPTNVLTAIVARLHGKPVVIVQHIGMVPYSNPVLRTLMSLANAVITKPMLRAATQVVFISEITRRHFENVRFKSPPRLVFNGVDTEIFNPPARGFDPSTARCTLGLPAGRPVALFVGRFVEKKGLHIIERLARLRPAVTFALAGWGPIDPAGWHLPNVHVLPGLSGASIADAYRASDVLVLPSTGEGLPLVIQEALACGLPVICGEETATADGGAAALLDGVSIHANDHDGTAAAFAARIDAHLSENAGPASPCAVGRHAYVADRYSWARAAEAYVDILTSLATATGTAAVGSSPDNGPVAVGETPHRTTP